jgi:hypothetical protein
MVGIYVFVLRTLASSLELALFYITFGISASTFCGKLWENFYAFCSLLFGYYNIKIRKSVLTKDKLYVRIAIST